MVILEINMRNGRACVILSQIHPRKRVVQIPNMDIVLRENVLHRADDRGISREKHGSADSRAILDNGDIWLVLLEEINVFYQAARAIYRICALVGFQILLSDV